MSYLVKGFHSMLGLGAIQWLASAGLQGDGNLPLQSYADSVTKNLDPIVHGINVVWCQLQ